MRGDVTPTRDHRDALNGRNFTDLAYLTGGVLPPGSGADGQFAVNGRVPITSALWSTA